MLDPQLQDAINKLADKVGQINDPPFPTVVEPLSAPAAGSGSHTTTFADTPQKAIANVLGWRLNPNDPEGFRNALAHVFPMVVDDEGHQVPKWKPRSFAAQSLEAGVAAITGAQLSLQTRARVIVDQIVPHLEQLEPLDAASDPEDVESMRALIVPELEELVEQFGAEGGPVTQRVDTIFRQLVAYQPPPSGLTKFVLVEPTFHDPQTVGGQLGLLRDRLGLTLDRVNTIEEEQTLTDFHIIVNYVDMLMLSWHAQRKQFSRSSTQSSGFFGPQLTLIERSLSCVAESVQGVCGALDSVFFGAAERAAFLLSTTPPITIGELLGWIDDIASKQGLDIIRNCGKDGIALGFVPLLDQVSNLVDAGLVIAHHPTLATAYPQAIRSARVQAAVDELAHHLAETLRLAKMVHRPIGGVLINQPTTAAANQNAATTTAAARSAAASRKSRIPVKQQTAP